MKYSQISEAGWKRKASTVMTTISACLHDCLECVMVFEMQEFPQARCIPTQLATTVMLQDRWLGLQTSTTSQFLCAGMLVRNLTNLAFCEEFRFA